MEIVTKKLPYDIGQRLYRISEKHVNVYRPCTLCHNSRIVTFVDEDGDGQTYSAPCPKCSGKTLKGDRNNFITISHYEALPSVIIGIFVGKDITKLVIGDYSDSSACGSPYQRSYPIYPEMTGDYFKGDLIYGTVEYFSDISECRKACAVLNKAENQKKKEFLNGGK